MTTDSIFVIFSTTKAITGRPCRSSSRKASLISTQPASRYAPEIGKLRVIDGFDVKGEPILRSPKRDITTRMLMTHTAGLSCDFINHTYNRLAQRAAQRDHGVQGLPDDSASRRAGSTGFDKACPWPDNRTRRRCLHGRQSRQGKDLLSM